MLSRPTGAAAIPVARGRADAVSIEKYEIEGAVQLADDLGGVSGA